MNINDSNFRKRMYERKKERINYGSHEAIQSHERYLKTVNERKKFNQSLFDEGMNWFNSGFSLQDAPENKRNNIFFSDGFNRGKRMALAREVEQKLKRGR